MCEDEYIIRFSEIEDTLIKYRVETDTGGMRHLIRVKTARTDEEYTELLREFERGRGLDG